MIYIYRFLIPSDLAPPSFMPRAKMVVRVQDGDLTHHPLVEDDPEHSVGFETRTVRFELDHLVPQSHLALGWTDGAVFVEITYAAFSRTFVKVSVSPAAAVPVPGARAQPSKERTVSLP